MDIEKDILSVRSKKQVLKLVTWVGKDKLRFQHVMKIFLEGEEPSAKKSAWILGHCVERHPAFVAPWQKHIVKKLQQPGVHEALKRNGVRILQFAEIPRSMQGVVANLCFGFISSHDESIAVRTFSMTVIANIAREEPALRKELETLVRQMIPYSTAAFRARAKKVLKNPGIVELLENPENAYESELKRFTRSRLS
jgi:hypothetical protein